MVNRGEERKQKKYKKYKKGGSSRCQKRRIKQ